MKTLYLFSDSDNDHYEVLYHDVWITISIIFEQNKNNNTSNLETHKSQHHNQSHLELQK